MLILTIMGQLNVCHKVSFAAEDQNWAESSEFYKASVVVSH